MREDWRDVVGFEGLYEVSNTGNVRNARTKKEYAQHINSSGYMQVCLTKDKVRKPYKVHRLVAMAFIPNPNDYPCINHKDETRTNNFVDNLEWCTVEYNNNYGNHGKRISESLKGHKQTEYWRKRIKESLVGVPKSEEHRRNLSIARTGKENPKKWKPVLCVETGVEYCSVKEAARMNNLTQSNLSNALLGNHKTAGGYHWQYVDKYDGCGLSVS